MDVNILKNNGVNVEKSLELFGDMATYNETLKTFLDEVDEKMSKIDNYKQVADMANYAILVHSLKSDARYFGFEKLAELAYQHELESKANHIYFIYEKYDELVTEARRIITLVKKYFGQEVIQNETPVTNTVKDKAILVVDDSDVIRSFVQKIFNNTYEVLIAHDGSEAIDTIANNDKICAMLLDLNMPNVNGFVVLNHLKTNNLFEKIPTSIITGVGNDEVIAEAFKYPIIDVLRKPFNERDIKTVVEKTLSNKKY